MEIFGQLEEFASELYPYRYAVGLVAVLVTLAMLYLPYRLGWHLVAWEHRRLTAAIGVPVLVVVGWAGNYTLSPLWERSTLVEASPLDVPASPVVENATAPAGTATVTPGAGETASPSPAATAGDPGQPSPAGGAVTPVPEPTAMPVETTAPAPTATPTPEPAFEPRVVAQGTWQGADEFHFARGKALIIETEPGKYVVRVEEFSVRNGPDLFVYLSPSPDGFAEGALNLGGLKATDGAFNYEVPEGTDIRQFKSLVVWCRQFAVLFGTATLGEGPS